MRKRLNKVLHPNGNVSDYHPKSESVSFKPKYVCSYSFGDDKNPLWMGGKRGGASKHLFPGE